MIGNHPFNDNALRLTVERLIHEKGRSKTACKSWERVMYLAIAGKARLGVPNANATNARGPRDGLQA
jgi:hypothetical protein